MVTKIKRLSILQTGKLLAVLYGFLSIVILPFILIAAAVSKDGRAVAPMLIMIILYPVMGFIGGIIAAALYNLAAHFVGGLEITLEAKGDE